MHGEITAGIYSQLHVVDNSGLRVNVAIHLSAAGGSATAWRVAPVICRLQALRSVLAPACALPSICLYFNYTYNL